VLVALSQPPLVGLSVDGDEVLTELAQDPDRSAASADVCPGAALRRHRPHEDEHVVDLSPGLRGPQRCRMVCVDDEDPLDDGALGTLSHEARVRACAQQQPEAGHDHRLARAGLTRQHGQAGAELDE
jgi:hypothetical protein